MSQKNPFVHILHEKGSKLSMNTIKTYASMLNTMQKGMQFSIVDDFSIKDRSKILNYIKQRPLKARKVLASALLLLHGDSQLKAMKSFVEELKSLIHDDMVTDKQQEEKQVLTKNQKPNWLDWKNILEVRDKLKVGISSKPSPSEVNKFMDYLIASLYTYNPPRRAMDYAIMVMNKPTSNAKDANYIDWKNQKFVFNKYKTSKSYATQEIPINDELFKILKTWKMVSRTSPYLLLDTENKPMDSKKLSNRLASIFNKPGFGVNILRHSYVSNELKDTPFIDKLKEMAEDLGHSSAETLLYKKRV